MDNSDNRKRAAKQQSEEGGEEGKEAKLARTTLSNENAQTGNENAQTGNVGRTGAQPILPTYDKSDDEEEEELSQEEIDAITKVVEEVQSKQDSQSEEESSQDVLQAIESHECDRDMVVPLVQEVENRLIDPPGLINPPVGEDHIVQLYSELLSSAEENIRSTEENIRSTGENIRSTGENMLINLKQAIQTMVTNKTAKVMFEQINKHVVPLVRTVATTCVGYYLGSYLLRYVGGIMSYLLDTQATITLVSLGSGVVHIVYYVGTPDGSAMLDHVVATANANIKTFLTGVSHINMVQENMQASVRETMLENTLEALKYNVNQLIAQRIKEQQEVNLDNILSEIGNLGPNDSGFKKDIQEIKGRLKELMESVEVDNDGEEGKVAHNDEEEEKEETGDANSGGKRVKRNKTKKTKAKKTVKRKAKKVKKTKRAKKAKKTVKRKAKKAKST